MGYHILLLNREYSNTHTHENTSCYDFSLSFLLLKFAAQKVIYGAASVLLCHALTSVSSFREDGQRIADIFLSRKVEFLVFTTYIGHYDRSMSLLDDSCRTSPAFAAVVQQFEVRPMRGSIN